MTRTHRLRRFALGCSAAGVALALGGPVAAPAANAAPALTATIDPNGTNGASVDNYDIDALLRAAQGIAETVQRIQQEGNGPTLNQSSEAFEIILDPSTAPGIPPEAIDELTPADSYMTAERGQTADGRTVVFPTEGRYTSGFGQRWGSMHQGIDIANNVGTPIYSVMDGTVISAGAAQGFGQWVRVRHANGEISVYGHVESYNVTVGQKVSAGQQIATMGNRGQSTGPHLHFEIRPSGGAPVDPNGWFKQQGITVRT